MSSPDFIGLAPAGHYIALRVGFAFPMEEVNALPRPWIDHYTTHGLMLRDPVMRWAYGRRGAVRWSALESEDEAGVLAAARRFGLAFGAATSTVDEGDPTQRSFGIFARSDREFSDDEIAFLTDSVARMHAAKMAPANLTAAEVEVLRMVRDGMMLKQIAAQLGVSQGAIKQRLRNAKSKLDARTATHAAARAMGFGLI